MQVMEGVTSDTKQSK